MSETDDRIPNAVPYLAGKEWEYLKECLDTNWVSSVGPFVDRFERDMASYLNARHGIAVVTGTAALHVALLAADVGQDDEVLVPSLTFIATANAIRYCGAWPVFMDSDPKTWAMDATKTAEFLGRQCEMRRDGLVNRATGRRRHGRDQRRSDRAAAPRDDDAFARRRRRVDPRRRGLQLPHDQSAGGGRLRAAREDR